MIVDGDNDTESKDRRLNSRSLPSHELAFLRVFSQKDKKVEGQASASLAHPKRQGCPTQSGQPSPISTQNRKDNVRDNETFKTRT